MSIMLFGKNKVSNKVHLISTLIVAIGTSTSAFWILSLNSWMQTPAGYTVIDGVVHIDDWVKIIFNPSFPYRFTDMIIASILSASFLVAGVSAWRARQKVDGPATWKVIRTGVFVAAILSPIQIFVGDLHGLNTLEHQPAKIAAIEAVWETERGAAFTLFGFPDEEKRTTHFAITIPKASSLILTHDVNGEVLGLNEFEGEHPPVAPVACAAIRTVVDDVFRLASRTGGLVRNRNWKATLDSLRPHKSERRCS